MQYMIHDIHIYIYERLHILLTHFLFGNSFPTQFLRKSCETAAIYKNTLKVIKHIQTNQSKILRMSPEDQKVWRKYGAHRVVPAMTQKGMKCILLD